MSKKSRAGIYRLKPPSARGGHSSKAQVHAGITPYEILGVAEQQAIYVKSARGEDVRYFLSQKLELDRLAQQCFRGNTNELLMPASGLYQVFLSNLVRNILRNSDKNQIGEPELGDLTHLKDLKLAITLSRDGVDYVSRVFDPDSSAEAGKRQPDEQLSRILNLFDHFFDDAHVQVLSEARSSISNVGEKDNGASGLFDEALDRRFVELTALRWYDLPGFAENEQVDRFRSELVSIGAAVSRHLKGYASGGFSTGDGSRMECGSQTRAAIRDWYTRLVKSRGFNRSRTPVSTFVPRHAYDEPVNVLPYVAVEAIGETANQIMVLMIEPVDPWFIDDARVPEDVKIPNISIGLYDVPRDRRLSFRDFRELQTALRHSLASLSFRLVGQSRSDALASAGGEASRVSRFWYSEGIASLFGHGSGNAGLDDDNVLEFWETFVEDLLCAEIGDVNEIEIYPFDRALILRQVGTQDTQIPEFEISILETGLTSIAPKDQGAVLASPMRLDRDLGTEFALNRKKVLFKNRLNIRAMGNAELQIGRGKGERGLEWGETIAMTDAGKQATLPAELAMRSIAARLERNDVDSGYSKSDRAATSDNQHMDTLRRATTNSGMLYSYSGGLKYNSAAPLITRIMGVHLEDFLKAFPPPDNRSVASVLEQYDDVQMTAEAKVVSFMFDPKMSDDNKSPDGDRYIDSDQAVTLILMADSDVEKAVPDINSEREDLGLLLDMIIRQKLQNKQMEHGILRNRFKTVESMLEGIFHKLSSVLTDAEGKAEIESQWNSVKQLMSEDRTVITRERFTCPEEMLFILTERSLQPEEAQRIRLESSAEQLGARVREALEQRVSALLDSFAKRGRTASKGKQDIKLSIGDMAIPALSMDLPKSAIRECFDVLFKNAVEAISMLPSGVPAQLSISIDVRPASDRQYFLDVRVDNTFDKILPEVWAGLTSATPQKLGMDNRKQSKVGHSTGIGVFAARQLLQKGYGRGADIIYESLGANRLRARMALPCEVEPPLVESDETDVDVQPTAKLRIEDAPGASDSDAPLVLYVEDEPEINEDGKATLESAFGASKVYVTDNFRDAKAIIDERCPRVLVTDMSIPPKSGGMGNAKFGSALIAEYVAKRAEREGQDSLGQMCVVLSGGEADKIEKDILEEVAETTGYKPKIITREAPWTGPLENADIFIMHRLKRFSEHDGLVQAISDFVQFDPSQIVAEPELFAVAEPMGSGGEKPMAGEWVDTGKTLADRIDRAATFGSETTIYVLVPGNNFAKQVFAWEGHPGMPDPDLGDGRLRALSNANYSTHVIGVVGDPSDMDSPALRHWLLRKKLVVHPAIEKFSFNALGGFANDSGGFLSILRHDIRNFRVAGIESDLFEKVETLTHDIEEALQFDTKNALSEKADDEKTFIEVLADAAKNAARYQTPAIGRSTKAKLAELQDTVRRIRERASTRSDRPTDRIEALERMIPVFGHLITGAGRD